MAAFISLNGDNTIQQPSKLKEGLVRKVHDRVSITGVARRIWMADKYQVTLTWEALTSAAYNQLAGYLYNQGNTVTYFNSVTGITFVGFPTSDADEFLKGNNFLRNLTTTILQV